MGNLGIMEKKMTRMGLHRVLGFGGSHIERFRVLLVYGDRGVLVSSNF